MIEIKGRFSNKASDVEMKTNLVAGILSIKNGVISLKLFGCLDEAFPDEFLYNKTDIWGLDFDGRYISLFQCEETFSYRSFNTNGSKHSEFYCRYMIQHFIPNMDYLFFNTCSLTIDSLNAWANPYFGKSDITEQDGVTFRYEKPQPITFKIGQDFSIDLYYRLNVSIQPFKFSDSVHFNIKSKDKRSFREFLEMSNHFVFLFSILWNRTVNILQCITYSEQVSIMVGKDTYQNKIPAYGYSINDEKEDERIIRNFPITFQEIKDILESILSKWHSFYTSSETYVIETLTTAIFKQHLTSPETFINLFQGIEAISDLKRTSEEKREFDERVKNIVGQLLATEDQKWVEAVLRPLASKSQREKIKFAFQRFYTFLQIPNLSDDNLPSLLKMIHEYRNLMVHPKSKVKPIDLESLRLLSIILKNLLTVLLFKKINLPDTVIHSYIKKVNYSTNYSRLNLSV